MDKTIILAGGRERLDQGVEDALAQAGHRVVRAGSVADALRRARGASLLLVDADGASGTLHDIGTRLRADPETHSLPLVVVLARDHEAERIAAFEAGADDVLTSPLFPREVALRARAIIGRVRGRSRSDVWEYAGFRVDVGRYEARAGDEAIGLTPREFSLLAALVRAAGRVVARAELLDTVWGDQTDVQQRTVDAHVKALRAKLGAAGDRVETVHGVGYRLGKGEAAADPSTATLGGTSRTTSHRPCL